MGKQLLQVKAIDPFGLNNMTGVASIVSAPVEMYWYDVSRFSLELLWTGTPTGTLALEGSMQYDPVTNPNAVFLPINSNFGPFPAFTNPAGAGGSYIGMVSPLAGAKWLRLRYTNSSGTGQLSAWFYARGRS